MTMNESFTIIRNRDFRSESKFRVAKRFRSYLQAPDLYANVWRVSKNSWRFEVHDRHFRGYRTNLPFSERSSGSATTKKQAMQRAICVMSGRRWM